MRRYRVYVREVWVQAYETEAMTPEGAISKVRRGERTLDEDSFEYSHNLDAETWEVKEVE